MAMWSSGPSDASLAIFADLASHALQARLALSRRANGHLLLMRALPMHGLTMEDIVPLHAAAGVPCGPV